MKKYEINMSIINDLIRYSQEKAASFGASIDDELLADYVFRNNTREDALNQGGAYFGFISPDEEPAGPYHDLSLVIFPAIDPIDSWLISLGVGTLGFKNDYELASLPGIRRLFSSLINEDGFCKTSILDIESNLPLPYRRRLPQLKRTLDTYQKLLPVSQILSNPNSIEGRKIISGFIAAYASIRDWAGNRTERENISKAINELRKEKIVNDESEVLDLLKERKYVILQGAPGTGKTRLAKKIPELLDAKQFFTQFHAQTDYSDFIYGIIPKLRALRTKRDKT
jgi:5-methylcytosine-specific restriction protein B